MRRPRCGVCVDDHTVSMSVAGSWLASTARVSIAMPPPRCIQISSSNTCAALAKAASTSPKWSAPPTRDVGRNVAMRQRRAGLHRLAASLDGRQDVVVDRDHRGGVLGHGSGCRRSPPRPPGRRSRPRRAPDSAGCACPVAGPAHHGDALGAHRLRQVVGGEHRMDAGHGERGRRIDRRILAWPCGLRTKQAFSAPGSSMSSMKRPRPASSAGSSNRVTRAPKCFAPMSGLPLNVVFDAIVGGGNGRRHAPQSALGGVQGELGPALRNPGQRRVDAERTQLKCLVPGVGVAGRLTGSS